jgi:DNA-binding transcriptional MerR regulator
MNMPVSARPIDIARELGISTSTLRHYEAWGIVPPVARANNGYRIYTEEHVTYFRCIREMEPGYYLNRIGEVMRHLMAGRVDDALWIIAEAKAELVKERKIALQAIEMLDRSQEEMGKQLTHALEKRTAIRTIGDVASLTGIPVTAIRYWEQIGLVQTERDKHSGYRLYNWDVVRTILLIRVLRTSGYSISTIADMLGRLNYDETDHAKQIAFDSLHKLERRNRNQLRGEHALYKLCSTLGLL